MKFIAFSGKKQSGKTTAVKGLAARLYKENKQVLIVNFADELKRIIMNCFGATDFQINGTDDAKNEKLAGGKSSRELMQLIGTDWFRQLDPDCWCRALLPFTNCDGIRGIYICGDVRFPNEVEYIHKKFDGKVIRLLRGPFVGDGHESETALDGYGGFDAIIDNSKMTIAEQNENIWNLVNEMGWV